jgi:CheY-like chemotaxis protein/Tfp pilus assembly protein PilZ
VSESLARPDVLVIESLALFREVEVHYLSRVADVRSAGNAAAALAAIDARRPALIVTALDLPDRPGDDLVRELRTQPRTSELPIVVLTRGGPDEHARAVRAGASDVLSLPLLHETLVQSVQRFVGAPRNAYGLPRARVACPVRLWDREHAATGTLRNLSRGGCFVESAWLASEGDELNLDFDLPGFPANLALSARLVWRRLRPGRQKSGAGFRFLELDGATSRALGRFVETNLALGGAGAGGS